MSPIHDLRYALRGMRQNPGFTAVVILVLALGIGANTAVFSLINGIVLKSLPVEKPEELVRFARPSFSYPVFERVQARGGAVFQSLFAWSIEDEIVDWDGNPAMSQVLVATDDFYSTLGISPIHGRTFSSEEEVAVISYDAWSRRFNRDPAVLGKTVRVGRVPMTIVGVTPEGFFGVAPGMAPEITIPALLLPKVRFDDADLPRRPTASWLHFMGRLKPGVTLQQANSALQIFWPQIMDEVTDPKMPPERRARFLARATELEPASTGFSRIRNSVEDPLTILGALVGLLLLVGCATIANLLLARAGARRQEMAIRLAVGASRFRIIRQLFIEGFVLAVIGGIAGLFVAVWGSAGLMTLLSTMEDPVRLGTVLDGSVLAFTIILSVVTAIVFAMVPAVRSARVDVAPALKNDHRTSFGGRQRAGRSLVVVQVGVSMVLVVGAALFVRSLNLILEQDTGFRPDGLLIVFPDAPSAGYEGPRLATFYGQLLERLRIQPGVQSVSLSGYPPISGEMGSWTGNIGIDGMPPQQREQTHFNTITPGFFRTVGIQLLQGRDFESGENDAAAKSVIVNRFLASTYFADQDPIGHTISVGLDPTRQNLRIVGVVEDSKYQTLQETPRRIAYLPAQLSRAGNLVAMIRADEAASSGLNIAIHDEIRNMDRLIPVTIQSVEDRIRETLMPERVVAILATVLGGFALLLAAAGLYGLMAYHVTRRTNELGLRIALGASRRDVLFLVLRKSLVLVGLGVIFGLIASMALGRFVRTSLYGITPTDPFAFIAAIVIMTTVAVIAGYLPARRASRVDPAVALRQG